MSRRIRKVSVSRRSKDLCRESLLEASNESDISSSNTPEECEIGHRDMDQLPHKPSIIDNEYTSLKSANKRPNR